MNERGRRGEEINRKGKNDEGTKEKEKPREERKAIMWEKKKIREINRQSLQYSQ